jgi:hypothetical protein
VGGPMTQTDAGTGEQVKEKAGEMAGQAQEKAQQAAGQARDQVRTQIDQRSTEAGQRIRTQADDLRSVGDQLRQQGKEGPAKMADKAAQQVERAGSWLTDSDADRILHDVEDAARKNPWAVVAGGLALGLVASRFLKASSRDRYAVRSGYYPAGGYAYGGYGGASGYRGAGPGSGDPGLALPVSSSDAARGATGDDGDRFARAAGTSGL